MSGLAVLFHRDGRPVERTSVQTMLDAVPYCGPDGMEVRLWGSVAFGHAKLAVTPEDESDQQPLVSPRTGCAIIADVRLDNRDELLAQLPDQPSRTASDAELILRAYEVWESDAAARLLGDFAFTIWDPRRQRVICARDTSGQRPLYYRLDGRSFAAASEIHQLFQDPAVPVTPNEERIRDFLIPLNMYRNMKERAATFYEGVSLLPAGHQMIVNADSVRIWQYWELRPPKELRYRSDDEYAEHYRELFFEVVRARLRSSRPIGVMLSGGLDSSSIACAAQELYLAGRATDRGFTSFSGVFDGLECDERDFIQDVADKYGFRAQLISVPALSGRLELQPRGFYPTPGIGITEGGDAIARAATRAGVRALLTGDIADGCVGGSRLLFDSLLRKGQLGAFRRHLRAYRRGSSESLRKILLFTCIGPLLPPALHQRLHYAAIRRGYERTRERLVPWWVPAVLREELVERNYRLALEEERGRRFSSPAREGEYRMLYPPEAYGHAIPWSLEFWRPFADRRLHEFLLAIPPEQKFEPHPDTDDFYAGSKRIVRRALRGVLPESIRTRTQKTLFNAACENEVQRNWTEYEAAFGPGARPEIVRRGYVDQALFWSRLQMMRQGVLEGDFMFVMQMVGLETWLRALNLPRPQLVTSPRPWDTLAGPTASVPVPTGSADATVSTSLQPGLNDAPVAASVS